MVQSEEYLVWMKSFSLRVRHVLLGKGMRPTSNSQSAAPMPTLYTATKYCSMLRIVCPDLFPQLFEMREKNTDAISLHNNLVDKGKTLQLLKAFPNMKLTMLPVHKQETTEYSYTATQQLEEDLNKFQLDLNNNPDYLEKQSLANKLKNVKDELPSSAVSTKERNEVILGHSTNALYFLGTGCAIPCKYRNVSGILLHLPSTSSMVLLVLPHTLQSYMQAQLYSNRYTHIYVYNKVP